jgi:hypothetical protein
MVETTRTILADQTFQTERAGLLQSRWPASQVVTTCSLGTGASWRPAVPCLPKWTTARYCCRSRCVGNWRCHNLLLSIPWSPVPLWLLKLLNNTHPSKQCSSIMEHSMPPPDSVSTHRLLQCRILHQQHCLHKNIYPLS